MPTSKSHQGSIWKCTRQERRLVERGVLHLLQESNGTVTGTLRAAYVQLLNDSGGDFPFNRQNIIDRIFKNLEKRSAIRIVRTGHGFNPKTVTAIELVDPSRFEVDGIVWPPVDRTAARTVEVVSSPSPDGGARGPAEGAAHDRTDDDTTESQSRRSPANSDVMQRRREIVLAILRKAPEATVVKKEIRDQLEREHASLFPTHDIVYHTLQAFEGEGIIRATPLNPNNFKLGQTISLVHRGAPAHAEVRAPAPVDAALATHEATPTVKRRRMKTPEELQRELAALDTQIAERIALQQRINAEIASLREQQQGIRQALAQYDAILSAIDPLLVREE